MTKSLHHSPKVMALMTSIAVPEEPYAESFFGKVFRFVEALMGPRQYLCCLQPVMGGRIAKFYYQGGALFPAPSGHRDEHYRHVMRETQASVIPCRVFPEEALEHALVLPLSCRSGGRGALVVRCSGDPQESQAGSSSRLGVLWIH